MTAADNETLTADARSAGRPAGTTTALCVCLECARPMAGGARYGLGGLETVVIGRGEARELRRDGRRGRLDVPDRRLSSEHVRLERALGHWLAIDCGSKNGVYVNGEKVDRRPLADGDVLEVGHSFLLLRDGVPKQAPDLGADDLADGTVGFATLAPGFEADLERLRQVAPSAVSVVLTGESGTGKEVVARGIHALSGRGGAFVAVNCGALPPELVESELFGHRKGAFSGATDDSLGLVRAADGGTLLLDEIGDLPASSQAAFLRVLQEREVMPVGEQRPVPVDLRVVAATHVDLDARVKSGAFRADLFARLNGLHVRLPPLRERREDLGMLLAALLRRVSEDEPELTLEFGRALLAHDWPLNVRELEKALEVAVALSNGGAVDAEHLPDDVRAPRRKPRPRRARELSAEDQQRRAELVRLLEQHAGNVSAVARAMGRQRLQIHRWIKRYGLDLADYR